MSSENALYDAGVMQKASALIIPCFVYLAILGVPLNFSAIIELYSVDAAVATIATTVEIAAIALASLLISFTLPKLNPRLFYVAGVAIAASGQLLTLLMESFDHAVIIRGLVGVGEGVILGIGFASLAQMYGGAKLLGISSGVTAGICFVEFMVVPMLAEHVGSGAVFWFLCAGFILLAPLSFFLPSRKIVRTVVTEASPKKLNSRNISLFLMALLISIGANSLWLYFDQIGRGLGLSPVEVGWIGIHLDAGGYIGTLHNWRYEEAEGRLPPASRLLHDGTYLLRIRCSFEHLLVGIRGCIHDRRVLVCTSCCKSFFGRS
ncbi:MFS transporter [Pseudomonas sp. PNP]|uniref:MFS transporter n=1 Tax=Pseudomonas sp. PNP TaxID=361819 RepID=UPI001AECB416|nr:MFS transporter [Pseudomonas sp. PNP]MBP2843003.1 MFS transporter [Pseudomonas sp. PNP]